MFTEYFEYLIELLAIEYNCTPDCFLRSENILTVSDLCEGRRCYSPERPFFSMVTMGGNTIATAHECLHGFLEEYLNEIQGHWVFEFNNLIRINKELEKYGYHLSQTHHMFLPFEKVVPNNRVVKLDWFYDRQIDCFYGDEHFPNAICPKFQPERPDRIVVCAYDEDGSIMGMAGCSEDAPHWMQIGVDVLPKYRSMGIGSYLVTVLKNKIIRDGDIPFYGTAVGNYHSWNIAINSGFRPTWVEIEAKN